MNGRRIWWIVAAVVVVAGLIAALSAESGTDKAYGEVAVGGATLPVHDNAPADAASGLLAPTLIGETAENDPITIAPGDGPMIVLFLAHWCAHCQAEVPRLTDWVDENGMPAGVDLMAVATSSTPTRGNYPPSAWLERESFPFPVLYDDEEGTAGQAYGLSAFPYWVVLDSNGRVVERFTGELEAPGALTDLFSRVAGL